MTRIESIIFLLVLIQLIFEFNLKKSFFNVLDNKYSKRLTIISTNFSNGKKTIYIEFTKTTVLNI
jgi:hypothetical protein